MIRSRIGHDLKAIKVRAGLYKLSYEGEIVGYVTDRTDDWYGEIVIDGFHTNACSDSKRDVEYDLVANWNRRRNLAKRNGKVLEIATDRDWAEGLARDLLNIDTFGTPRPTKAQRQAHQQA